MEKYAFAADDNDHPAPTNVNCFVPWGKLIQVKPPLKPPKPPLTWGNPHGNQNNNNNNNSVSPYLDLSLKNDGVDEIMHDNKETSNGDEKNVELAMMALTKYNQVTKHIWLADSGASSHMCIQDDGMFNVKMILSKVTIGNGKSMVSPKLGDIWMTFQTKEGKKMFLLENVK